MNKLIEVKTSSRKDKKYVAVFQLDGKEHKIHFGAKGYPDFTMTADRVKAEEKKRLYLIRHQKNENWNDYTSPGALSRWLLWNKPTLEASIQDFKRRFHL